MLKINFSYKIIMMQSNSHNSQANPLQQTDTTES